MLVMTMEMKGRQSEHCSEQGAVLSTLWCSTLSDPTLDFLLCGCASWASVFTSLSLTLFLCKMGTCSSVKEWRHRLNGRSVQMSCLLLASALCGYDDGPGLGVDGGASL